MLLSETGSKIFYKKFYEWVQLEDLRPELGISTFTKKFKDERTMEFGPENTLAVLEDMEQEGNDITFIWTTPAGSPDPKKVNDNHEIVDNPEREYILKIKFIDFLLLTNNHKVDSLEDFHEIALACNIQIDDNDPSFQWQGMNYNISQLDGSLNPTDIPPSYWRKFHHDDNFLSKFMQGLIDNLEFFYKPMMEMFNEYNAFEHEVLDGEEVNINDEVYDNPYNIDGFPGDIDFEPEYIGIEDEVDINTETYDNDYEIDLDSFDIDDTGFEVHIDDDDPRWTTKDINNPEKDNIEFENFDSKQEIETVDEFGGEKEEQIEGDEEVEESDSFESDDDLLDNDISPEKAETDKVEDIEIEDGDPNWALSDEEEEESLTPKFLPGWVVDDTDSEFDIGNVFDKFNDKF